MAALASPLLPVRSRTARPGHATAWSRSRAFSGLVRVVLDVRLVAGLLAVTWAWIAGRPTAVVVGLLCWMVAMLVVLLRWDRYAEAVMTHPVLHLLDLVATSALLAGSGLVSPVSFLLITGGLFTGLCLGWRGAAYFSPGYVAAWLLPAFAAIPDGADPGAQFLVLVVVPVLLVAMLCGGAAIQAAVIAAAALEATARREREAAAVAEERARLARELHDSVTKSCHGIALLADALPAAVRTDPEGAATRAGQLAAAARTATRESRALLGAMRRTDATADLATLLHRTAAQWEATHGRSLDDRIDDVGRIDPSALYEVAAIVDEALENAARHTADDTRTRLTARRRDGWIEVTVSDNGPGIAPEQRRDAARSGHFGLAGIEERAARIGARLQVASSPGRGTTVSLDVPVGADG